MDQQELIHLHALLVEIRRDLDREETLRAGAFDAYDSQPVRPTHLHRRKEAHKQAMNLLRSDLIDCVQRHPPPDHTTVSEDELKI
ncbi:UPF0058 family protein [Haloterrigena salinisoli]|uniref:UPF0058 family protein n=1 Tax=Haloterrigena salinisoli TaxID=3132747 RepID=UPI0030D3564F